MSAATQGHTAGVSSRVIFISYSHDSGEHRERVLGLAERLRQDGLDAQLDRFVNGTPEQGWPRWMLDRVDEAAFVLVVCTETYYRRFRGHEVPGRGKGSDWEGALITQEIYDAKSRSVRFVPVLLAAGQESFIPEPLRGQTHYEVTSEESYQTLYSFLLGHAGIEPVPLGEVRTIPRRAAKPLRFDPEPGPASGAGKSSEIDAPRKRRSRGGRKSPPKRRPHPLLWLASPTVVLLPLVGLSTFWHVPTRVQVDLTTVRLAVTLGGAQRREVFDRSVPFSTLLFEDCSTAVFAAEKLEVADPRQLVPATEAGKTLSFPDAAWHDASRRISNESAALVKLSCQDPAAKLTLQNPDPNATRLGSIRFAPGSQLILEVSPGREPALRVGIETPQELNIPLGRDLELVTEFVQPEGVAVPFSGDLLTWRARLPEGRRKFEITGERGLVLVVTPARGKAEELFRKKLDFPILSVELLEEDLEGPPASPLSEDASLSYPDHPAIPAVIIENAEAVALDGLSQARLTHLHFDTEKSALRARFEGIVEQATSRAGSFTRDHRLTLYHTFRDSWRWGLIAVVAVWLGSTTWTAFGLWKKLQE